MKMTGITRPIDELGRIVLPKELRRTMNIQDRDMLEIGVEDDRIIATERYTSWEGLCTFEATFRLHDDQTYVEAHRHKTPHGVQLGRITTRQTSGTISWNRDKKRLELEDRESFSSEDCKIAVREFLQSCGYKRTNRGFWSLLFGSRKKYKK